MYTDKHTRAHRIWAHIHIHAHTFTHTHACTNERAHTNVCVHVCACVCVCVCNHIQRAVTNHETLMQCLNKHMLIARTAPKRDKPALVPARGCAFGTLCGNVEFQTFLGRRVRCVSLASTPRALHPPASRARRPLAVTVRLDLPLRVLPRGQSVQRATTVREDLRISRRAPLAHIHCPSAPRRPQHARTARRASTHWKGPQTA